MKQYTVKVSFTDDQVEPDQDGDIVMPDQELLTKELEEILRDALKDSELTMTKFEHLSTEDIPS